MEVRLAVRHERLDLLHDLEEPVRHVLDTLLAHHLDSSLVVHELLVAHLVLLLPHAVHEGRVVFQSPLELVLQVRQQARRRVHILLDLRERPALDLPLCEIHVLVDPPDVFLVDPQHLRELVLDVEGVAEDLLVSPLHVLNDHPVALLRLLLNLALHEGPRLVELRADVLEHLGAGLHALHDPLHLLDHSLDAVLHQVEAEAVEH